MIELTVAFCVLWFSNHVWCSLSLQTLHCFEATFESTMHMLNSCEFYTELLKSEVGFNSNHLHHGIINTSSIITMSASVLGQRHWQAQWQLRSLKNIYRPPAIWAGEEQGASAMYKAWCDVNVNVAFYLFHRGAVCMLRLHTSRKQT